MIIESVTMVYSDRLYMYIRDRRAVSKRTSKTCPFVGICSMRLSQGIETEGAGSLLM